MKPSSAQLSAFTQAARDRSFSTAARTLGITQSAVTQHVAALEKRMGQQLFIRRRQGLQLTRAAVDLFEITDRLMMLQDLAEERIGAFGDLQAGQLQVIANSPRPALPLIAEFNKQHPNIEVLFTLVSWTEAVRRLADHDVDVAIVSSPPEDQGLVIMELNRSKFMAHLRADDPLAGEEILPLERIADRGIILPEQGSLTQKSVRDFASKRLIDLGAVFQTTTFPVVQEAVLHRAGIGVLLEDSLYPHPLIRQKPIRGFDEAIPCSLVTLREKRRHKIVDRLFRVASDLVQR